MTTITSILQHFNLSFKQPKLIFLFFFYSLNVLKVYNIVCSFQSWCTTHCVKSQRGCVDADVKRWHLVWEFVLGGPVRTLLWQCCMEINEEEEFWFNTIVVLITAKRCQQASLQLLFRDFCASFWKWQPNKHTYFKRWSVTHWRWVQDLSFQVCFIPRQQFSFFSLVEKYWVIWIATTSCLFL